MNITNAKSNSCQNAYCPPTVNLPIAQRTFRMCEHVTRTIESKRIAWSEKAIVAFDSLKRRVNENKKLPCSLQVKIDRVAANIVDKVSPKIQSVNDWIDSNGHGLLWRTILTF
jgi:hypothetical protein